jgi:hypothetical protein
MNQMAEPEYEEQFTAFVDFLGFSEATNRTDDDTRLKILNLLQSLSALRGEFAVHTAPEQGGNRINITPAISSFSDNIVISYPLSPILASTGFNEHIAALSILWNFNDLLTRIASAALSIGFLIRGGATIGKLYHAKGVVFGEALVDAYQIESRTSVYPRVIVSSKITSREEWMKNQAMNLLKGQDGLYYFDCFTMLTFRSLEVGENWAEKLRAWYHNAADIIGKNLIRLENEGKLNELSKWAWYAHEFRSGLRRLSPEMLKALGLSLDAVSWPNI